LASRIVHRFRVMLEKYLPEKRLFIRSDTQTRFIRLTPSSQLIAWAGGTSFVAWSIIATSFLLMDAIGSGSIREQAKREQRLYEMRLNDLSMERDTRATEARMARDRFNSALDQISSMQLALLASEDRRKEMEKGIEVIQFTLRRTIHERDAARAEADVALAGLGPNQTPAPVAALDPDTAATLDFLTAALDRTAQQRDAISEQALRSEEYVAELELEQKLLYERNDRIFSQLEDAVSLSLAPLDKMFAASGMPTERILDTVRRGYSGQGGPLSPLTFSTRGQAPNPDSLRANGILEKMDRMNLYRIAADKMPFSLPIKSKFRHTSGFGPRWGRMHSGTDFAAAYGTPVHATADGVIVFAGWQSSYGRLIKIQHEFGVETRFAHLAQIRVKVGQKVSRGDRIGDMGNSGRSTGTHLHYEIRAGGKALNPMTYIKAANDVF